MVGSAEPSSQSSAELSRKLLGPALTFSTQFCFLQVDPLHRVRRRHDARVIFAVCEVESVADFMDGLFDETSRQQFGVSRQAIKFLRQAMKGNHGARAAHLRLAKDKRENRNVEIDAGN